MLREKVVHNWEKRLIWNGEGVGRKPTGLVISEGSSLPLKVCWVCLFVVFVFGNASAFLFEAKAHPLYEMFK